MQLTTLIAAACQDVASIARHTKLQLCRGSAPDPAKCPSHLEPAPNAYSLQWTEKVEMGPLPHFAIYLAGMHILH